MATMLLVCPYVMTEVTIMAVLITPRLLSMLVIPAVCQLFPQSK